MNVIANYGNPLGNAFVLRFATKNEDKEDPYIQPPKTEQDMVDFLIKHDVKMFSETELE